MIGLARLLILLGILLGLWMVWRWLMRMPPEKIAQHLTRIGILAAIFILVILAATGRLPPVVAAIGTALGALFTFAQRLLRMPGTFPLLQRLFFFYRQKKNAAGPSGGQRSRVETRFLRMFLDHDSGEMGGEIIAGRFGGYRISELDLPQLIALWYDYSSQDPESAALLEAYLDRIHGESWREQCAEADASSGQASTGDGEMTAEEARKILDIELGATEEEVIAAHRRLVQRLHPDRGGSAYLAAKINRARDVLIEAMR